MSKRGWQPLNRWKRVPSKQNDHESTEQNADSDPEQSVQGPANTLLSAMRETSTKQCSIISQETSSSTRQSASGYDTKEQCAMGQDTIKQAIWRPNTVAQGSRQSAMGPATEQAVLHQDAIGLSVELGVTDDDAKCRDDAGQAFERETIGVSQDLAVAEKNARRLGTIRHSLNMNAIKDAILETGTLEQFALRKDVILGLMGRDAVEKCDRILSAKDSSNETDTLRKPAPIETMEQATGNVEVTKLTTPQSATKTKVATRPFTMEPYTQGPSASGQYATTGDDMRRSTLDSAGMTQFSAPYFMEQDCTELVAMRQYCAKPDAKDANQLNTVRKSTIEPDGISQATTDQVSTRQPSVEPGTIRQIAIGQGPMRQFTSEPGTMEQIAPEYGVITSLRTEDDANKLYSTEPGDMGLTAAEDDIIRSFSIEPATMVQIATRQGSMQQSSTETGSKGQTNSITKHDPIRQLSTEPGTMGQATLGQDFIKSCSTESVDVEVATTGDIGQAAVLPKLKRSDLVGTSSLPAIQINTTEPAIMGQIVIDQPLKQSTMELGAIGQAGTEPGALRQNTTGQGQDAIQSFSTKPIIMEQATTDDLLQTAVLPKSRRSTEVGTLDLPSVRISTTEPAVKGQTAIEQPLRQSTEPVSIEQITTTPGTQSGLIQYCQNDIGQSAIVQKVQKLRRSALVGSLGLSAINISATESGSRGQISGGQDSLRQITTEPGGIGQSFPSDTWTQTDLFSESTQRHVEYHPLHRTISKKTYIPNWIDLDRRPLPRWYDEAKVGIIVHWGLYSVPSYKSEWFWYLWKKGNREILQLMSKMYRAGFTYQEFGAQFKAQYFDPVEWATLFAKAGAKYVILTAKHHDGFRLFPSKSTCNWNSYDVGPKRDIVKELSEAVVDKGLKFGIYYSLYEWFNPIYKEDKKTLFKTRDYVNDIVWPDLMQLVNSYKPSILWTDGDWEANEYYWKSEDFISWLYNDSPIRDDVVVNNRWGCKQAAHGDFYNRDERHNQPIHGNGLSPVYNCADKERVKQLRMGSTFTKFHKWEVSVTMDKQLCWCHRRELKFNEVMTIKELLLEVVSTVSCGGNILINVGPTQDGLITPLFEERLLQLGEWLEINGEAIYGSSPWIYQTDEINNNTYYTCIKDHYDPYKTAAPPVKATDVSIVYTIFFKWPLNSIIKVRNIMAFMKETPCLVMLLGENMYLTANLIHDEVYILLPDIAKVKSNFAWTLKFISKSSLKDDLGSIVIPLKDTALKLSKSGSRLGSKTGMKSSSKIISRLGSTSKSYTRAGSKMSKLHFS